MTDGESPRRIHVKQAHGGLAGGRYADDPRAVKPEVLFPDMLPRVKEIDRLPAHGKGGPIKEWFRAIKGEGPMPGSNFDYAVPLTEVVLLGAIAQRTGKTIEWDAENMTVKGRPELDALIKEPARPGWEYGEQLA